jgi:periplasmic divalent cation tolerance protein
MLFFSHATKTWRKHNNLEHISIHVASTMQTISIVNTTVGSIETAKHLATKIVEARLAGCVQIDGPITSIYNWQGKLCDDTEFRLTCKTLPWRLQAVVEFLQANHSYEVPEIIVSSFEASSSYMSWLSDQVSE